RRAVAFALDDAEAREPTAGRSVRTVAKASTTSPAATIARRRRRRDFDLMRRSVREELRHRRRGGIAPGHASRARPVRRAGCGDRAFRRPAARSLVALP